MTLTTHHLEFTAVATTSLELDAQAGASIRGAIVGALWERFCTNKASPTCEICPLVTACPVAALIAPMREEGETGGAQRPRPYVIQPPQDVRRYRPGEEIRFRLALFGRAAQLFPYVVMAAQGLEQAGLGRKLAEQGYRRGTLFVRQIAALNPLAGTRQVLYQHGQPHVQAPGLPISAADVAAYAATLPIDRLSLHFQTPLRLIDQKRLVKHLEPRPLLQRLTERLDQLARAYGDGPSFGDHHLLLTYADRVQVAEDQTQWIDVVSYSSRTQQRTPIGGLIGSITLTGDLTPLRELLVWGMLIHVGKNAVKGDGWYTITA